MTTQTLRAGPAPTIEPEVSAAAVASPRPVGNHATLLTLRLLAAAAILTSAYLHFVLALENGLGGELFTMPQLFIGQATVAAIAGGVLLVGDRELLWLPAVGVAIGSTLPILASVYFPLPAIGPMPPINEPIWYDEKLLSLAVGATVPVLYLIRRIAPPARS
ncbi:MAG TPA: hypothetical protein VHG70_05585 [Nocardioidaceae bacterium]|nr:hypothetical protein [Nocardioidaceae bacterium]